MKKILSFIILLLVSINCFSQWELKDTIEFKSRNNLPNFFNKVNNNKAVSIGFIGGSITAANGWRPRITEWLKDTFNLDTLSTYSAAIGATNSQYGVYRIDRQLLSIQSYDLIFVEFAVNDGDALSSDVERDMEGIVRKIWKNNPTTDICFVYTADTTSLEVCQTGKMNLSATKHDSIASYYGIPSLYWTLPVYNMIQTDTVVWKGELDSTSTCLDSVGRYVFSEDGVHPTSYGYDIYTAILASCIDSMKDIAYVKVHDLKSPIYTDNYENALMLPYNSKNNHGFSQGVTTAGYSFLYSSDTTATYKFSFYGKQFGLNFLLAPTGSNYIIEVDSVKHEFMNFDDSSCGYSFSRVFVTTDETREHFVKIYPSSNRLTLADKREILGTDSLKQDLDSYSYKYNNTLLYFSDILVDGYITNDINDTIGICSGDTLEWGGRKFTDGGDYYFSDTLANGFDSLSELHLLEYPTYNYTQFDTILIGNSLEWEGSFFTTRGHYIREYQTVNGCDSILNLYLIIDVVLKQPQNKLTEISVYFDQTTKHLQVESLSDLNWLSILDLNGSTLYRKEYNAARNISVDLSNYHKGIYLLKAESSGAINITKFFVQ